MQLRYDRQADAYEGRRYRVSEFALNRRLLQVLAAGYEPNEAHEYVLDEDNWNQEQRGVHLLARPQGCRCCHRTLPPRRHRFCDVVCEAMFIVASLG